MHAMTDMKTSVTSESAQGTLTSNAELDKQAPPSFGHAMHKLFEFDPSYVNFNHGEFYQAISMSYIDL